MGFFSSICGAISSAVSTIGSAVSSFASGVGTVIGKIAATVAPIAESLGRFASVFLQILGILKPDEKVEEMGERALQAAEKGTTIDQFDDFDSYMEALRDFPLDPEVAAKRTAAEKLVAGIGVCTVAMERKFDAAPGSFQGLWLLPIANPTYFTPERMQTIVSTGKFSGDVFAYLEKRLSAGDSRRVEDALAVVGGSKAEHYDALDQARDRWEQLGKEIEKGV